MSSILVENSYHHSFYRKGSLLSVYFLYKWKMNHLSVSKSRTQVSESDLGGYLRLRQKEDIKNNTLINISC